MPAGRATLAGQVEGEHPGKERYPGPPGWGLGVLLATAPRKKIHCCEGSTRKFWTDARKMQITGWRAKLEDRQGWNRIVEQTKTHPGLQSQQKKKKKSSNKKPNK
jgi:hypothetical protein